jgi:DNA-3-methyladenine glycosylase
MKKIENSFFLQDVLQVAPLLIGKYIVRKFPSGKISKYMITETEAYRGEEDMACHASKGITPRTKIMYDRGGNIYVYLVYGMHWMLNIVTGEIKEPQAVLIRSVKDIEGPGRLTKKLEIEGSFYGEDLSVSERIWIEEGDKAIPIGTTPRIGIDYAGEWKNKCWRFVALL